MYNTISSSFNEWYSTSYTLHRISGGFPIFAYYLAYRCFLMCFTIYIWDGGVTMFTATRRELKQFESQETKKNK